MPSPARPVYLDHNATHPVDEAVLEAMLPWLRDNFGHPMSRAHSWGWAAEKAMDTARARTAALIGSRESEIVFTSGGTESCNLAIYGVAERYADKGRHIVACAVDQRAVLDPLADLESKGWSVDLAPVDACGLMDARAAADLLREDTVLLCAPLADLEVGTLQPIAELGAVAKEAGVLLHVDATIGLDTEAVDVQDLGIDLLSMTAHRMYGPKGAGALYVRRRGPRVRLAPRVLGGGHERGRRSGTPNLPGLVGLGKAAELAAQRRGEDRVHLLSLRNSLEQRLLDLDGTVLNGHPDRRLPGTVNVSVLGVDSEALIMGVRDLAMSSGAACTSATLEPSHVLRAMDVGRRRESSAIRMSMGRDNTSEQMVRAAERIAAEAERLRALNPLNEAAS